MRVFIAGASGTIGTRLVMLGMRESYEDWQALGRDLIARGWPIGRTQMNSPEERRK